MHKFSLPKCFPEDAETVWEEYGNVAEKFNPIDLGQGFPDYSPPEFVKENLIAISRNTDPTLHQYTRNYGHPRLVTALSNLYSNLLDRKIDPREEFVVMGGAYKGLFCGVNGFIGEGDEVVIIEPFFDCYKSLVTICGGIPKFIPLRLKEGKWVLNQNELESVFNEKTKMIILNTPHNPTGKVFTENELKLIADLCIKWNVLCLCDEVYEWSVYNGKKHTRMCTIEGMWHRTLTIGSAGKTFGITGWKLGWIYGDAKLMENIRSVFKTSTSNISTPMQETLAMIFENELANFNNGSSFMKNLSNNLQIKRDYLLNALKMCGLKPIVPEGGYFMLVDFDDFIKNKKVNLSGFPDKRRDYRFTKYLAEKFGILMIPSTAFFHEENKYLSENYFRLCFVKKTETLEKVREVLKKLC